jgi:hypothetical protein
MHFKDRVAIVAGDTSGNAGGIFRPANGAAIVENAERHFGVLAKFDSRTPWPSVTAQGGDR